MKKFKQLGKSLGLGLLVLLVLVIYAYGFQVTKVNLDETRSERRQTQLVRILRALAHPEILAYNYEVVDINVPIMVPCPAGGFTPEADKKGPYMIVTPTCAEPGGMVQVEGFGFQPNLSGPLNFIPPSDVKLGIGNIETDASGHFLVEAKLPKRPTDQVQNIRATTRKKVGGAFLSQVAKDTWDKIIETVFLALLATTFGTLLSVPLSFLAARNLMKDITSSVPSVALDILLIPVGVYLGWILAGWVGDISQQVSTSVPTNLVGMVIGFLVVVRGLRWALPQEDEGHKIPFPTKALRGLVLATAVLAGLFSLYFLSNLAILAGTAMIGILGSFGFVGTFLNDLGEILRMVLAALAALAGGGVLSGLANRLGNLIDRRAAPGVRKILTTILSPCAGMLLFVLILQTIDWFYLLENQAITLWWPAAIGATAGLALALFMKPKDNLPVGMVIYYAARTIFNALRSIESLVMVIVFVVWVGIGPFAGVLALSLHTIAALAKLYSEQVESIMTGPVEAVKATGANRLQTIIYAVIPQIIPPYISFTMYRWDINVRMSTIIGFAGGGGIGFLLIQNINLLNYHAASVQMLAIAVVVASMDYLSSRMREEVI